MKKRRKGWSPASHNQSLPFAAQCQAKAESQVPDQFSLFPLVFFVSSSLFLEQRTSIFTNITNVTNYFSEKREFFFSCSRCPFHMPSFPCFFVIVAFTWFLVFRVVVVVRRVSHFWFFLPFFSSKLTLYVLFSMRLFGFSCLALISFHSGYVIPFVSFTLFLTIDNCFFLSSFCVVSSF